MTPITDETKIARAIKRSRQSLPPEPKVVDIRYKPYVDSRGGGEDSLQVWIVLDEGVTLERGAGGALNDIARLIDDSLQSEGIPLFPYTRFAKKSELEAAGIDV